MLLCACALVVAVSATLCANARPLEMRASIAIGEGNTYTGENQQLIKRGTSPLIINVYGDVKISGNMKYSDDSEDDSDASTANSAEINPDSAPAEGCPPNASCAVPNSIPTVDDVQASTINVPVCSAVDPGNQASSTSIQVPLSSAAPTRCSGCAGNIEGSQPETAPVSPQGTSSRKYSI